MRLFPAFSDFCAGSGGGNGRGSRIAVLSNAQEAVTVESVQAMIDALPDAKNINDNNIEEVKTQFQAIQDAMIQLSVEDSVKLDIARYIKVAVMLYGPFSDVPNPILGTELKWVFRTKDKTLTVSGNGEMPAFGGVGNPACPWENERAVRVTFLLLRRMWCFTPAGD